MANATSPSLQPKIISGRMKATWDPIPEEWVHIHPPPIVTPELETKIQTRVIEPTLRQMEIEGRPFRGALFVGLMIVDHEPYVLEYNVRFGDPETECLMVRLGGKALPLFEGSARGDLSEVQIQWSAPASLCVVLASGGYPGPYEKGKPIYGLDSDNDASNVTVFHAGTTKAKNEWTTSGGRVLCVSATGSTLDEAASRAYQRVSTIRFTKQHYRKDIGWQVRTPSLTQ